MHACILIFLYNTTQMSIQYEEIPLFSIAIYSFLLSIYIPDRQADIPSATSGKRKILEGRRLLSFTDERNDIYVLSKADDTWNVLGLIPAINYELFRTNDHLIGGMFPL